MLAIGVYPLVEAWITGDKRDTTSSTGPATSPSRTGLGVAWLSLYGVLLIGGGNDIVATHLASLHQRHHLVRCASAFFVVPVVAFVVTKRICLGLQRRDRDKVLHGRETGIIERLPHGEYVEVHEPLSPGAVVHAHAPHEQDTPPYEVGPPARRRGPGCGAGSGPLDTAPGAASTRSHVRSPETRIPPNRRPRSTANSPGDPASLGCRGWGSAPVAAQRLREGQRLLEDRAARRIRGRLLGAARALLVAGEDHIASQPRPFALAKSTSFVASSTLNISLARR